jgi:hypothetical protein
MDLKCATIHKAYHDILGRKYIDLLMDGRVIHVKIPFRYNRVMCRVDGITPIQEFKEGTLVEVWIERKTWDGIVYHVLRSVREISP